MMFDDQPYFCLSSELVDTFVSVMVKHGIREVRLPKEGGINACDWIQSSKKEFFNEVVANSAAAEMVFRKHGLKLVNNVSYVSSVKITLQFIVCPNNLLCVLKYILKM